MFVIVRFARLQQPKQTPNRIVPLTGKNTTAVGQCKQTQNGTQYVVESSEIPGAVAEA